jgi:hypothetical protein
MLALEAKAKPAKSEIALRFHLFYLPGGGDPSLKSETDRRLTDLSVGSGSQRATEDDREIRNCASC